MPGKYSHSVVLADYLSRGVISLPEDQHTRYANPPIESERSPIKARLRGTRSAHTISYQSPPVRVGCPAATIDQPYHSLNRSNVPNPIQTKILVEDDRVTSHPTRYSHYYKQVLNSTPITDMASHLEPRSAPPVLHVPSVPLPLAAYQRQQNYHNLAIHNSSRTHSLSQHGPDIEVTTLGREATEAELNIHPVFRYSASDANLRKDFATTNMELNPEVKKHKLWSGKNPLRRISLGNLVASSSRNSTTQFSRRSSHDRFESLPLHQAQQHGLGIDQVAHRLAGDSCQTRKHRTDSNVMKDTSQESMSWLEILSNSDDTLDTEIYAPQSFRSPPTGPGHFDPSDQDVYFNHHFADPGRSFMRSRSPSPKPQSQAHSTQKGQKDGLVQVASSRKNSKRHTSFETTASSTFNSSYGYRSPSSASSISMMNSHSQLVTTRTPSLPYNKENNTALASRQSLVDRQPWRLSEIEEDHNFTPSIFEAEGRHDDSKAFDMEDTKQSIGQISSGKDVDFDNDAASDLSAALPPPISRFRDEEDEFNANMAKMFGEGGDSAIMNNGNHPVGKIGKKKSFFSKFLTKSASPLK